MASYRLVYDSRHMQADCQEPGSAPEAYARSAIEYGLPLPLKLLSSPSFISKATKRRKQASNVSKCNITQEK